MSQIVRNSQLEIMSPVGSFEALNAAVEAGADSVYFGVGNLNMRSSMNVSFVEGDLKKIAEICRQKNVKTYLTLNAILYNEDIRNAQDLVIKAKENGISAIIACDPAIMSYCRKVGIPVHISTQTNVTNIETIEYYSLFSDTMVLGRELSLKQIAEITRQIQDRQIKGPSGNLVRIEIFVHGYFCMAVSGKCYLSLNLYNSSANRGECKVPCQRRYLVTDQQNGKELLVDNEFIFSAKDLCTIDFIDQIIESGASVLKIEGRKKGADYVYTTTKCYREAADAYLNGTYTREKAIQLKQELATVFNRGFWSGYYLGKEVEEEAWNGEPKTRIVRDKIYVGECIKISETSGRVEFRVESQDLQDGDDFLIVGDNVGVFQETAKDIKIDDKSLKKVKKGEVFSLPSYSGANIGDKLYKAKILKNNYLIGKAGEMTKKILGNTAYNNIRQFVPGVKIKRS